MKKGQATARILSSFSFSCVCARVLPEVTALRERCRFWTEQSRSRTFEKMASVRYPLLHLAFGFLLGFRRLPTQLGIQPGKAELPADL